MVDRVSIPVNVFVEMSQAAQEVGYKPPASEVQVVHEQGSYLTTALKWGAVLALAYVALSTLAPMADPGVVAEQAGQIVPYVVPAATKALFSFAPLAMPGKVGEVYHKTAETLSGAYETTTSYFSSFKTMASMYTLSLLINSGARLAGR